MVEPPVPLLAPEDLASQLSTIEVLLSIYNGSSNLASDDSSEGGRQEENDDDDDDVLLTSDNYKAIRSLAQFLSLPIESLGQSKSVELRDAMPAVIQMGLKLDPLRGTLDEEDGTGNRVRRPVKPLVLDIGFAVRRFKSVKEGSTDESLKPRWNLRHADWLDRPAYEALCRVGKEIEWEAEESVGYIMNIVEAISEASLDCLLLSSSKDSQENEKRLAATISAPTFTSTSIPVLRTWHLLISLSMKDKRKDLVTFADRHNLTGFVLAGKPGLVVLECPLTGTIAEATKQIDSYWSDIKTTSWSDLPPVSKKVSEKYREERVERRFPTMQEVTGIEELGGIEVEEGGRVKRNDLDKLKLWLKDQGCVGQLDIVLGKEV